jgi:hypothetical protein
MEAEVPLHELALLVSREIPEVDPEDGVLLLAPRVE